MDNPFKSPNVLSLCTGMRGLERGLERAIGNFRTVAYVEIESFIIWNLVTQMEQGILAPTPVWSNLKTFPWSEFYGKVHGIVGGYPCQPFSVAGKQKGADDPRHLWPFIKEGISTIRPVWCFFENVPGHINIGFREVKSDLESMGYRVEAGIYSAEEVGAPHQRKRLFILGILDNSCSNGFKSNNEISTRRYSFEFTSKDMANPNSIKLERCGISRRKEFRSEKTEGLDDRFTTLGCKWPAKPGEQQNDWESPRAKSRMGFTVNGYNFREDLLRMAGNGVVEQTAELAFIDLLRKHGIRLN